MFLEKKKYYCSKFFVRKKKKNKYFQDILSTEDGFTVCISFTDIDFNWCRSLYIVTNNYYIGDDKIT